jgi:hypothetical protein
MSAKSSINLETLERDRLHIELCLIEFLTQSQDLDTQKSFNDAMTNKNLSKMLFMISNDDFSKFVAEDLDEEAMLDSIRIFLQKKSITVNVICDLEKLKERDPNDTATFVIDIIALIKVFNPRAFKYHADLLDHDVKSYIEELIAPTVDWMEESMEKARMDTIMEVDTIEEKGREKQFEELFEARKMIRILEEENKELEVKNIELSSQLQILNKDLYSFEDKLTVVEDELSEKYKENLELIEKFQDVAEENKQIKQQSHELKERCNDYILSEERYINQLNDKDVKINKLHMEIEEGQKSITLFELQLKEFSKLVTQYKNEKESFQKRKEVLNVLQKSNHDKNEMLYYFNHKNHQLEVEKQKLDQYIKLCQYQIQRLTDEEKRLKHENHVLKALNENLMELGAEEGGREKVVIVHKEGGGGKKRDNSKLVRLLKENVTVGNWFIWLGLIEVTSKTSCWT